MYKCQLRPLPAGLLGADPGGGAGSDGNSWFRFLNSSVSTAAVTFAFPLAVHKGSVSSHSHQQFLLSNFVLFSIIIITGV